LLQNDMLRPFISDANGVSGKLREIMKRCWSNDSKERPHFCEIVNMFENELTENSSRGEDLKKVDELKRELREGEERQKWELEQRYKESQKKRNERMLLLRRKREERRVKKLEEEGGVGGGGKGGEGKIEIVELAVLDDQRERLEALQHQLFEAQKDCVLQKRIAFNAESQLEEARLEIKALQIEVKKAKVDN